MDNPNFPQIPSGNARFANNMYTILADNSKQKNLFFSPLSAHAVLAMCYQGAAGETADKLANALSVPNQKDTADGYNCVMRILNSDENGTLHVANKIYVMQDFPLKSSFNDTISKLFLSEVELIDFKMNQDAANNINQWVENKTNSKIKDLITSKDMDDSTRLVLINAIYFKGDWIHQFKRDDTKTEPFYISDSDKVDCQMMHIKKSFYYCENKALDAQLLQLPYKNQNCSMIIILPNARDGITSLEKKIADVDLSTLTKQMDHAQVVVSLPKFRIETTMSLKSMLQKMDLGVIFDRHAADFSEISESTERLHISEVIQKTYIEVNEEGTEAAAATMTRMVTGCCRIQQNQRFIADHPFIFLLQIKHENCTSLLFCGKVMDPTQ